MREKERIRVTFCPSAKESDRRRVIESVAANDGNPRDSLIVESFDPRTNTVVLIVRSGIKNRHVQLLRERIPVLIAA